MTRNVVIKKSSIQGKGVFAARDFSKGEVVLSWRPKLLKKDDLAHLTKKQQSYVQRMGRKYYLMQTPEKFVNHSNTPNTYMRNNCDIARGAIKQGQEITTRYNKEDLYFLHNAKFKSN